MFSLYGDLSAENRMSRLGLDTRRGGPNSGSSAARSASIGALTSSSYCLRCASNQALLLFARNPRKKPLKSPRHPWNVSAATEARVLRALPGDAPVAGAAQQPRQLGDLDRVERLHRLRKLTRDATVQARPGQALELRQRAVPVQAPR